MTLTYRILEYIEQASAAANLLELGCAFQALAKDYGYSDTILIDAQNLASRGRSGPAILFTTLAEGSVQSPDPLDPLVGHPSLASAQVQDTPIFLDELGLQLGIITDALEESLPPHLRHLPSLLLPVHRQGKLVWYVGCRGPKPDRSALAVAVLQMGANVALEQFEAIKRGRDSAQTLSPREAACLRSIAAGKSNAEISAILGIAPRTVRFHVDNAKKKLGVQTRLQAVAARTRRETPRD